MLLNKRIVINIYKKKIDLQQNIHFTSEFIYTKQLNMQNVRYDNYMKVRCQISDVNKSNQYDS